MKEVYDGTPAGAYGRLDTALDLISNNPDYEILEPEPATNEQLRRAHSEKHVEKIKSMITRNNAAPLHKIATLAAGGAILTAETAMNEIAFGLIRPPGHHASRNSCWGFCYYSNMAIALLNLRVQELIESAAVIDFDLHVGDGTINIVDSKKSFYIHNPSGHGDEAYLDDVARFLDKLPEVDIIAASAGFDQYEHCWGGNLSTEAFHEIGRLMARTAEEKCQGRLFGILEGGYNHADLGKNVHAFCTGMKKP